MNLDSPLVTLPDIPLKKVLEKCGYMGIQSLRKTCRDLRNFIDDSSLELGIQTVKVVLHPLAVSFEYKEANSETIEIEYFHKHRNCSFTRCEGLQVKRFSVTGKTFIDGLTQDLAIVFKTLGRQKTPLEELRCMKRSQLDDGALFEDLTVLAPSLNTGRLLKVRKLFLKGYMESEFSTVLSFVDSKFIKKLHLANSTFSMPLEVDEIATLDQWKAVQNLTIVPQFQVKSVRPFLHFRDLHILVQEISREDIAALLERFRASDPPRCFEVRYADRVDPEVYGVFERVPLVRNRSTKMEWYFKNMTTGMIIYVKASSRDIQFKTMNAESVPSNAIVYE